MLKQRRPLRRLTGFTAIELLTAISILAILMAIGVPSLVEWVRNNKVRAVANTLQNGLRSAQSDALSRSQSIVLFLTNTSPTSNSTSFAAVADGKYWATLTIPGPRVGETAALLNTGALGDIASQVTISGPSAICFNGMGRLTTNASPGPSGASCALPTSTAEVFDVSLSGARRRLRVMVTIGGQVRMCNPDKNIATSPDGCPT